MMVYEKKGLFLPSFLPLSLFLSLSLSPLSLAFFLSLSLSPYFFFCCIGVLVYTKPYGYSYLRLSGRLFFLIFMPASAERATAANTATARNTRILRV